MYAYSKNLDPKIEISDNLQADLLLEHSRLSQLERRVVVTQAAADKLPKETEYEGISRSLQKLHPKIQDYEVRKQGQSHKP